MAPELNFVSLFASYPFTIEHLQPFQYNLNVLVNEIAGMGLRLYPVSTSWTVNGELLR